MANVFDRKIEAGELLVLKKEIMSDKYKGIENRLFIASGNGSGCLPDTTGSAVYGHFVIDDEEARYEGDEDFDVAETEEWQRMLGKFGNRSKKFIALLAED